jgi:hypothetical protein
MELRLLIESTAAGSRFIIQLQAILIHDRIDEIEH